MGVLNVSAESPYDPSVYDDPGEAAEYVDEELIGEGADIVDVGLESANKDLDVLSAEQELDRLDTAIETLESTSGDAVWSIETRYHEVADEALARGFDMVNDICGFADPEMPRVCREHDAAVSKMASPPDLERPGAIEDVDEIYEALSMNGLTDKTILDPAFGGWSKAKPTPTTARRSTGYGSSAATVARCSSRSTARASSRRSRDGVPRRPFRCRSPPPRWQSSAAHT